MQQQTSPLTTASPRALEELFNADVEGFIPEEIDIYTRHLVETNRQKLEAFKQEESIKAMKDKPREPRVVKSLTVTEIDDLLAGL